MFVNIHNIANISSIIINKKIMYVSIQSNFFRLMNVYDFIFESFFFELIYFYTISIKKLLLSLKCRLKQNLFLDLVRLIEYLASGVIIYYNPILYV